MVRRLQWCCGSDSVSNVREWILGSSPRMTAGGVGPRTSRATYVYRAVDDLHFARSRVVARRGKLPQRTSLYRARIARLVILGQAEGQALDSGGRGWPTKPAERGTCAEPSIICIAARPGAVARHAKIAATCLSIVPGFLPSSSTGRLRSSSPGSSVVVRILLRSSSSGLTRGSTRKHHNDGFARISRETYNPQSTFPSSQSRIRVGTAAYRQRR
ncbi:hypothetical protein FB004_11671 [Sinorhizobium medicae]|nr:hypothetical protein FB004_11671 [Sinorhizobium medicae]